MHDCGYRRSGEAVIPHCRHDIIIDENLLLKGLQIIYEKTGRETVC